ncbi:MAG: hypothetical protein AB7R67_20310 [Vicinamibacterales bacterium]
MRHLRFAALYTATAALLALGGWLSTLQGQTATVARCPVTSVTNPPAGHRIVITCPPGTVSGLKAGQVIDIQPAAVVPVPPVEPPPSPPPAVNCVGAWGSRTYVSADACPGPTGVRDVVWRETFTVTTPAANGGATCAAANGDTRIVRIPEPCTGGPAPPVEPTPAGEIFGVVDPAILGTCSAAVHDAHFVVGTDGVLYRTWHPQTDPTGCIYAHEHGDNPANATQPDIAASLNTEPLAFGFIGRKHGDHDEPHEGFKVFLAKRGQVNDEDRTNLTDSLSVFHMGTGGPRRATTQFHSNDLRVYNPDVGGFIHTRLMMDTGDKFDNVCDPRGSEPTKDGFSIPNRCQVTSGYEIWATVQCIIRTGGQVAYCPRAVPAVFDPITVFNRANPTEVVYAWDDRFKPYRRFPNDDWTGNRGCIRENYAQIGYSQNQGGPRVIYTDAMGREVVQTDPGAIKQVVPTVNIVDHRSSTARPGEAAGNQAFKFKVDYCGTPAEKARLGLKN